MLGLFANKKEKFILIGYSFGSLLAIKFTSFLEAHGMTGNTLIVDGSPEFISAVANQLMPADYTDEHIQGIILMSCIKLLFRDSSQEISKKIFTKSSMEERFQTFLEIAATRSEYSIDYGRKMITGLQNRLKISLNANNLSYPIIKTTPVTFVRASESSLSGINEDYGLKKFVESDMKINVLNGDHLSILSSPELVDILSTAF